MMLITQDWLRERGACYCAASATPEQLALLDLLPEEGAPLSDVLRCDAVPAEDRIWVWIYAASATMLRRWLGVIVRRALSRVESPDPRSLAVLEYLDRGERPPEDVRAAAWAAAMSAAMSAARAARSAAMSAARAAVDAAWDAARSAAWAAAWAAVDAAWDAARTAAWDAARTAARAAELDAQLKDAIALLEAAQ